MGLFKKTLEHFAKKQDRTQEDIDNADTTKCIQIYTSSKIKNIHINI